MRCIKCKKEIDDNLLRCNFCNTKVQTLCPVCGSINPITAQYCAHCGLQLLKYCPHCKCVNLPGAEKCRKCGEPFDMQNGEISIADLEKQLNEDSPETPLKQEDEDNKTAEPAQEPDVIPIKETEPLLQQEFDDIPVVDIEPLEPVQAEEIEDLLLESDSEEDFQLQELQEDELLDFSDGENIDEVKDTQVSLQKQEPVSDMLTEEPEPVQNIQPEGAMTSALDSSDNDLLSLCDLSDAAEETITEELKKADIKPDPIINADAAQNYVAQTIKTAQQEATAINHIEDAQKEIPHEQELAHEKEQVPEPLQKQASSAASPEVEPALKQEPPVEQPQQTAEPAAQIQQQREQQREQQTQQSQQQEQQSVSARAEESFEQFDVDIKSYNQMKCKNLIVNAIRKPEKLIIGLSAPEGYGKSTVLKYLFGDLMHENYGWLWGECSANSQISPFGIFQEMILTFFNMPNFSNMSQDFVKQAKHMLSQTFPFFSQEEIFNLFNFLYPSLTSNYEDILVNKDSTFALLEKLILELSKKVKLIIVIDDFDMIDGASYAFLSYFVEQGHLGENIKLIISYKDNRITQGYFYSEKIAQNQYEDIRLSKLTKSDADNLVKLFLNGVNPLPQEVFERIFEYSEGNSAYIEQIMVLLNDFKAFKQENGTITYKTTPVESKMPKNLYEILSVRINYLQKKFPLCFRTLCTASIMGNKFNVKLLEIVMKLKPEEFQNVMQLLTSFVYVAQFNNNIFEFKNTLLWKFVYEKAKQNKDFVMLNEKIFDVINSFTLSSNALKALIAQNLNQKLLALNIWTENTKLCAYLGDEHLWTLSQKQCLKIVQEIHPDNDEIIANNIQERLGKMLYLTRPSEAIPLLSAAISNALKVGNRPKIIELSGYLSKSCSLTGNYNGVIEAVDVVLKIIDTPQNKLESALIKYKKLKAMFCIGNAEEIYNLASNEIIPVVEQALSNLIPNNGISMDIIYETWLECNLIVVMALVSQGNNKSFAVLKVIDEIIAKNNVDNKNYLQRVDLAKALAYSVQGDIKKSDDILISLSQKTSKEIVEPDVISLWNFTNILNKLYKQEWQNIKEDLYSVVTFANNYNDVLVKNLLKVFLGKILQEEGNLSKALEIYNEQVTIFAREKIAIGALLCWYYIAKLTLVTEGTDKALDIAQKALEVAKNPKISNYYFMVLYKKLIAEIFLIKGDTEAAKMYIEKALMIVKQYDMKLLKISLYQLYAKYLEEMLNKKPQNKANYAQNAVATYKKALSLIEHQDIPAIKEEINKNYASFRAFCQLNNIKI